jgi:hypothetical protein
VQRQEAGQAAGQLSGLFRDLRKALKNRQLYSHIESHGEEQIKAIYGKFSQLVREVQEFSLRVEVSSFFWGDVEVFNDDGHDINFGYSLYRAGVRLVVFKSGISWDEFLGFWSCVSEDLSYRGEEDLLTRLWRYGLENISWVAKMQLDSAEEDDALVLLVQAAVDEEQGQGLSRQLHAENRQPFSMLLAQFSLQAASTGLVVEDAQVRAERERQVDRARAMSGAATMLIEMTQLQSFPEADEYFEEAFEQLGGALVAERNIPTLGLLAEQAAEVLQQPVGSVQGAAARRGVAGLTRALVSPGNLAVLRDVLGDPSTMLPQRPATALVRLLFADGCQHLLYFLETKLPPELRAIVLRALSGTTAEQAALIARRTRNADEKLAAELLGVIGALQVPKRALLCEPALTHPSRQVRRMALEVISRSDNDAGVPQLLARHLERCTEPEERVELVGAIARFDNADSEKALMALVQREGVEPRLMQAAWSGLLAAGTPTAFAFAERVAKQPTRGLLGSAKDEEKKAALLEALGQFADARSARMLAAIAHAENASSRTLLKRAQELVAAMRLKLGGGGGE